MAYSWQNTNKNTNTGTKKYSWQTGSLEPTLSEKVTKEKQIRESKGLPVSVREDRAEPTALGSIVRSMIKPLANVATNIYQSGEVLANGKASEAPLSNKYLGKVEGLGQADFTEMPWSKKNLKVIAKSAGTGAEIASYLGAGGAAKGVVKNVFAQPLKQFIKKEGVNLVKEGAIQGLSYSLGTQGQTWADEGIPLSLKQTVIDTGLSTVITPIAGYGLNKLFGRRLPEILKDKNINNLLKDKNWGIVTGTQEKLANKEFPQAFMHPDNIKANKNLYSELVAKYGKKNVVELPSSKYEGVEQGVSYFVKNLPEKDAKNLGIKYGQESVLTNKGFVSSDGSWIQPSTGEMTVGKEAGNKVAYSELPTGQKFSMGIAEDRVPTVKPVTSTEVPNIETKVPNVEQPIKEIPTQPKVEVSPETLTNDAKQMSQDIEGFDEGTFKQWSQDLRSLPKDELMNVALGGDKTIKNTIPKTAYYSTLKNIAKETNDVNLSQMLANSPVRSKGGQELVANKLSQGENLVDDLIEIKKMRAKQVGISDTRYEKESQDLFNKIKTKIETMKQQIPTVQEIEDIISNNLICK